MYAIIKVGGKQYKVQENDYINVDLLDAQPKETVTISDVLAVNDGSFKVGTPFVDGAKVELEVVNSFKDKKVIIYKKRRRKDSKLKKGFRKQLSRVKVSKISL